MRVPLLDSIAIVLLLPLQLQLATQDHSSPLEAGGDVLKGTGQEEELCCHGGGDAGVAEACECLRWNLRSLVLLDWKTGKYPSGGDRGGMVL